LDEAVFPADATYIRATLEAFFSMQWNKVGAIRRQRNTSAMQLEGISLKGIMKLFNES
jgi:hypothetical protein